MFTLRAAVMWTVNDFPAYAMVSGWSTKGYMACPVCKEDVTSGWHAGKFVTLVIGDGCHGITSGGKKIKSSTGTQSVALDLENGPVMRSSNSLTVWILLRSEKQDSDKARRDLAFFSMKPNDKKEFLKFVSSVKFPDGRGIACWSCQLSLDVSNRNGEARRGLGSI
ncbi:hypothetical protein L3X38_025710 [Prunus dulcis]|uniref:Uncharacterized protein n=1 Tax=Prunus dulcis TaxID=3755 RepID=A0AAD4W429_PRUDU|nr:hypothetical protein L3X38_025710 [Prunus dulcis]